MKKALITFALAVLFACSSQSYGQYLAIYGAYQDCPFHCRTIRINADFTFEYRLDGDLFNDERYKGTWRFIGRNKIRATSPEDHSSPNVTEKLADRVDDY